MQKKCAIITGATRGLGEALAARLAATGYYILGVSRNRIGGTAWNDLVSAGQALHVAGDVAHPDTSRQAIAISKHQGELALLVNCAGTGAFAAAGNYTATDMFSVLGSNLTGTILFCDASVAPLKDTKGSIVNIISTAAFTPRVNETVYCGAKWGARGYTEALRLELKPFGVRVLGVYPGGMDTDFWKCTHLAPPDASKFMSAHTVADMIISNITHPHPSGYVSDLIINRG